MEEIKLKVEGHIKITDKDTGEVILDDHNAINNENMSISLAKSLANQGVYISEMVFGNGGVKLSASGEYIYNVPQTLGRTATLYNETYFKKVDDTATDKENNYIYVSHSNGNIYSNILVRCTLDYNEPQGQNVLDNVSDLSNEYTYSEIGLRNSEGDLITHKCFSPKVKSSNSSIIIDYLLQITMV